MNDATFEPCALTFKPIFKRVIWGGTKAAKIFSCAEDPGLLPVGEVWTIVDREKENSVIAEGKYASMTLRSLIEKFGRKIIGKYAEKANGGKLPLMVKVIDAGAQLSLQVHPDEKACEDLGGGIEQKNEMWYVLEREKGAEITAGLADKVEAEDLTDENDLARLRKKLHIFEPEASDSIYIPAGCVHAIGGGLLILEIQQSSDTTFRISDWGRVGRDGKPRQLHKAESEKSIRENAFPVIRKGKAFDADDTEKVSSDTLIASPFFTSTEYDFAGEKFIASNRADFTLVSAVSGDAVLTVEGCSTTLKKYAVALIPACTNGFTAAPADGKKCRIVVSVC